VGLGGAFRVRQPGADPSREPAAIELLDDGRSPHGDYIAKIRIAPDLGSPARWPGVLSIWRPHRRYSARPW
jgi:hypothetical protein